MKYVVIASPRCGTTMVGRSIANSLNIPFFMSKDIAVANNTVIGTHATYNDVDATVVGVKRNLLGQLVSIYGYQKFADEEWIAKASSPAFAEARRRNDILPDHISVSYDLLAARDGTEISRLGDIVGSTVEIEPFLDTRKALGVSFARIGNPDAWKDIISADVAEEILRMVQ